MIATKKTIDVKRNKVDVKKINWGSEGQLKVMKADLGEFGLV